MLCIPYGVNMNYEFKRLNLDITFRGEHPILKKYKQFLFSSVIPEDEALIVYMPKVQDNKLIERAYDCALWNIGAWNDFDPAWEQVDEDVYIMRYRTKTTVSELMHPVEMVHIVAEKFFRLGLKDLIDVSLTATTEHGQEIFALLEE